MSSLASRLGSMRRLAGISPASRSFLARAWLAVPIVELSLALAGVQGTLRWIDAIPARRGRRPGPSVEEGGRLVRAAYRRHPLGGACLSQSLLQYLLHRRDGIPARLVVGVKRDQGSLQAHAWVEPPTATPSSPREPEFSPILVRASREADA